MAFQKKDRLHDLSTRLPEIETAFSRFRRSVQTEDPEIVEMSLSELRPLIRDVSSLLKSAKWRIRKMASMGDKRLSQWEASWPDEILEQMRMARQIDEEVYIEPLEAEIPKANRGDVKALKREINELKTQTRRFIAKGRAAIQRQWPEFWSPMHEVEFEKYLRHQ